MDNLWILTAFSLYGNVLNVKKNRLCFAVWIGVNICWAIYDIICNLYSRAVLDIVQTGFCVWGLAEWQDNEEE